jgi:hypothetical protein
MNNTELQKLLTCKINALIAARNALECDNSWSIMQRKGSKQASEKIIPVEKGTIKITDAVSLDVIMVPTFDYVKQDGDLYYVKCADHFAVKIGGKLLHGHVGHIYVDEKNPVKVKDCKYIGKCNKGADCDYYHDPIHFHHSRDHRNYIASSWLYSPLGLEKKYGRARKFGSINNIDIDLSRLCDEDVSRYHDQTMHDILCSLILHQARKE